MQETLTKDLTYLSHLQSTSSKSTSSKGLEPVKWTHDKLLILLCRLIVTDNNESFSCSIHLAKNSVFYASSNVLEPTKRSSLHQLLSDLLRLAKELVNLIERPATKKEDIIETLYRFRTVLISYSYDKIQADLTKAIEKNQRHPVDNLDEMFQKGSTDLFDLCGALDKIQITRGIDFSQFTGYHRFPYYLYKILTKNRYYRHIVRTFDGEPVLLFAEVETLPELQRLEILKSLYVDVPRIQFHTTMLLLEHFIVNGIVNKHHRYRPSLVQAHPFCWCCKIYLDILHHHEAYKFETSDTSGIDDDYVVRPDWKLPFSDHYEIFAQRVSRRINRLEFEVTRPKSNGYENDWSDSSSSCYYPSEDEDEDGDDEKINFYKDERVAYE